jgi:hypothetical protein
MTNEVDVITFRPGVAKDIIANVSIIMFDNNCIIANEKNIDTTLNGVSADATKENAFSTEGQIKQQAKQLRVSGWCDIGGASANLAIVGGCEIKGAYDTYQINKNSNRILNVKAVRDAPVLPPGAKPSVESGSAPAPASSFTETDALFAADSPNLAVSAGTFKQEMDKATTVEYKARIEALEDRGIFDAKCKDALAVFERRSDVLKNSAQENAMRATNWSGISTNLAKGADNIIGSDLKLSEAVYARSKVLAEYLASLAQKGRKGTDEGVDFAVRNTQSSISAMEGTLYGSNYKN